LSETYLKLRDIVTAQIGTREKEQTLTESPTRLNESVPGDFIDLARDGEAFGALKGFNECHGLITVDVG
jgi:hypothetical protein